MRRAARVDDNHGAIVKALRQAGYSVLSLAPIGRGCPDLLVGVRSSNVSRNVLIEVKDGSKPPSARMLTADERAFHATWAGQVAVVDSIESALAMVTA